MANTVAEIMNRELFGVPPMEPVKRAMDGLLALGISSAPVINKRGRAVGIVSLRAMAGAGRAELVEHLMSTPPISVREDTSLVDAARLLGRTGMHHLVVCDAQGIAVGFVSALDLLRGLVGLPAVHPPTFPHRDAETGVSFTDDTPLDLDHLDVAPEGPGVLLLIHGREGEPETMVWAEASTNVRARLYEMLTGQPEPMSGEIIAANHLRFRSAAIQDFEKRREVAAVYKARIQP